MAGNSWLWVGSREVRVNGSAERNGGKINNDEHGAVRWARAVGIRMVGDEWRFRVFERTETETRDRHATCTHGHAMHGKS